MGLRIDSVVPRRTHGRNCSANEQFKALDTAYGRGYTFWDIMSKFPDTEELVGKWFEKTGKRPDIFLCTQCGLEPGNKTDGSSEHINITVERSLQRLGVDYIDLCILQKPDPNTPIEISMEALAEFANAGKIRYLGISGCSATTLRRAASVHPISAVGVEYSPFALESESPQIGLLATARELGVTVLAYKPFGHVLLGPERSLGEPSVDELRRTLPGYSLQDMIKTSETLKHIANYRGQTASRIALAWLMQQGDDIIPMVGPMQLKEHGPVSSIKLSSEEMQRIRAAAEGSCSIPKSTSASINALYGDTPSMRLDWHNFDLRTGFDHHILCLL